MKYWCPECKSIYTDEVLKVDFDECGCSACPVLNSRYTALIKLPDFETPQQYEKRTGKKWKGLIWQRHKLYKDTGAVWSRWMGCEFPKNYREHQVLCANSPESPPDDYVPEETL